MSATLVSESAGGAVASGSCVVPEGARAALLLVPDRFRLDVRLLADTLRIQVRGLGGTAATMRAGGGYSRAVFAFTPLDGLMPACHDATIDLQGVDASYEVPVVISVMSDPATGLVTFGAQAVIGERAD